jgi:hypothetical protein
LPARFALDQNFPEPIVDALDAFIPEADLVPFRKIDPLLTADMDDWEVLLALHHHPQPWDGLVTTDSGILNLPRELAVLVQTRLTLVVAEAAGQDPVRATGLVLTHLSWIAKNTDPNEAQLWRLSANNRPSRDPWEALRRVADHQNRDVDVLWREARLTKAELAVDPLGP